MSTERFKKKLQKIKRRGERQKVKYELESRYAEFYPSKKRKVSNVMLVVVVCAVSLYTIANLWITYTTGTSIDSTLTTCVYAFWSSELVALTALKTSKIIKGTNNVDEIKLCEDCDEDETMG